jgi:type IV pilus assembly protein PilY1
MVVLGNGPDDFNGDPVGYGHIYIVDMLTGALVRDIQTADTGTFSEFVSSPVSIDLNTNFDTDIVYAGSTIKNADGSYAGKMYRISADSADTGVTPDWNVSTWVPSTLMELGSPVTAAPGVLQDDDESIWVFFGTGRYIGLPDKSNTNLQKFYGIADPCSPVGYGSCSATLDSPSLIEATDLFNVTNVKVYETGYVTGLPSGLHAFTDLLDASATYKGWVRNLSQPSGGLPSERVVSKPGVIGGLVIFPSFFPSSDLCGFSGDASLYFLYYKTGTAFSESVIGVSSTSTVVVDSKTLKEVKTTIDIGVGLPSQVAIHVGKEAGGKTFTQMSTSAVVELDFTPAKNMKSGPLYWREMH